ncbi:hypothetical protein EDD27_10150 [Nonomuraea polychroma]|uniref:Uncharacterized protein n=1 Tax=Nonomuraea polychroma TaxID=46176 RepID=A0A438MN61_9ACTN|nr:hypothetical protein [Nonomuraea polychroma]RVX47227.1 hypothetical protein EDD27_10150 [Nonomuraea polychroma]
MNLPAKIASVALAAATGAVSVPVASPALAAEGDIQVRNVGTGLCLTLGHDPHRRELGLVARSWHCQSRDVKTHTWRRIARSQLANVGTIGSKYGTLCLGPLKGSAVLMRRCGSDRRQRLTFTVVDQQRISRENFLVIKWKGRSGDMCLRTNFRQEVFAERCQPGNRDAQWRLVNWDWS